MRTERDSKDEERIREWKEATRMETDQKYRNRLKGLEKAV